MTLTPFSPDAEINHHVACIQALQQMRHPHIKSWSRMNVDYPDAEGFGSIMIIARRTA